jgi:hypothetical protein
MSRSPSPAKVRVEMKESDLLCLWAACVLREPEPLTRLLKKILKPVALRIRRHPAKSANKGGK